MNIIERLLICIILVEHIEYIENSKVDPETEKWERLFNYVQEQLLYDKKRKIIVFGSGCGELALKLQDFKR